MAWPKGVSRKAFNQKQAKRAAKQAMPRATKKVAKVAQSQPSEQDVTANEMIKRLEAKAEQRTRELVQEELAYLVENAPELCEHSEAVVASPTPVRTGDSGLKGPVVVVRTRYSPEPAHFPEGVTWRWARAYADRWFLEIVGADGAVLAQFDANDVGQVATAAWVDPLKVTRTYPQAQ